MIKLLTTPILLALAVPAFGDEQDANELSDFDRIMQKYERTGEMKHCIFHRRIRGTTIVDENHIILRVTNRESYLTKLPRQCRSLKFHQAIAYEVRGSSLCERDMFRVIELSRIPGPYCSFGEFEKIIKKRKSDS